MKVLPRKFSGFTWIELLVVLAVLGTLAALAIPAVSRALVQGQLTQTHNFSRQIQIATQMMALDTERRTEGMDWTSQKSKGKTTVASLAAYFDALTGGKYLSEQDLKKILTAPGRGPGENSPNAGNISFKFFQVDSASPIDQPLVVTANWQAGKLTDEAPYGKRGFVVFTKGGSGCVYNREEDAASPNIFPMFAKDSVGYHSTILK